MYDQEYQENYRPEVNAFSPQQLYTLYDQSTGKYANAWNNPADHFSKLFTESFSASYVTGSHAFKAGVSVSERRWRLEQQWTGDIGVNPTTGSQNNGIAYNGLLPNGNINPVSVTFRLPFDRRNAIKADTGMFVQDRWTSAV